MAGYLRERFFPRGYYYYDTPEGEDCDKKLWYVTKNSALYGVLASSIDVLMFSHPKGYLPTLGRFAYITFPFMGMGAAFVVTTCMATNFRKKDDMWNYFLGGTAVGAVMGAWQRSLRIGFYGGFALGVLFLIQKDCMERGLASFSIHGWEPQKFGNIWSVKRDFSILADPGRTWKTSSDE
uniref:NADH dehydrogenase [ubiquinone] 1 alpha subcomplex subunit 11 n=1 Tax=Triatoma infestans TaxID=30076 RepID=A0A023F5Z7_TRIIF